MLSILPLEQVHPLLRYNIYRYLLLHVDISVLRRQGTEPELAWYRPISLSSRSQPISSRVGKQSLQGSIPTREGWHSITIITWTRETVKANTARFSYSVTSLSYSNADLEFLKSYYECSNITFSILFYGVERKYEKY